MVIAAMRRWWRWLMPVDPVDGERLLRLARHVQGVDGQDVLLFDKPLTEEQREALRDAWLRAHTGAKGQT